MKIANLKKYYFKRCVETTGRLGSVTERYSDRAEMIRAYIYPSGGQIQAHQYGQRLSYMLNMIYSDCHIATRDGVCVYVKPSDMPDYKVVSIKRYTEHYEAELERIL